jgi:hypothetical protein
MKTEDLGKSENTEFDFQTSWCHDGQQAQTTASIDTDKTNALTKRKKQNNL